MEGLGPKGRPRPFRGHGRCLVLVTKKGALFGGPRSAKNKRRKKFPATTYSPTGTPRSTIGAGGLNCRVRHGTGCVPSAMITENLLPSPKTTEKRTPHLPPKGRSPRSLLAHG